MIWKVTVDLPSEEAYKWFVSFLYLIEARLGIKVPLSLRQTQDGEPAEVDHSTVRYRVRGDQVSQLEVLRELGPLTIAGLIFEHLMSAPKTNKQIRREKGFNGKTVSATLYRFQQMGVVDTVAIAEDGPAEAVPV